MCPDPTDLDALVEGSLEERDRERVLSHLDGCASCAEVVAELARMRSVSSASSSVGVANADTVLAERPPSAAPAALAPAVGRYQVKRRIGQGGMGTVFEAFDPEL